MLLSVRPSRERSEKETIRLAALMALLIVFFLPRMHERYFYLAGALALTSVCAVGDRRLIPAAAALEFASLACLWETGLPLAACSVMALASGMLLLMCPEEEKASL